MAGGIAGAILGSILPGVVPSVTEIAKTLTERLVPDLNKRAEVQSAIEQALVARDTAMIAQIQEQNAAQNAINLQEASSASLWVSGWRPAVAWICVFGFAYSFILAPMIGWFAAILGVALGVAFPVPPSLDNDSLFTLLAGMLGLSGIRSFDKVKGVATDTQVVQTIQSLRK